MSIGSWLGVDRLKTAKHGRCTACTALYRFGGGLGVEMGVAATGLAPEPPNRLTPADGVREGSSCGAAMVPPECADGRVAPGSTAHDGRSDERGHALDRGDRRLEVLGAEVAEVVEHLVEVVDRLAHAVELLRQALGLLV